ncbi:ATP-binding protein [Planotetraspora sp. A-T 1434]|uniref:ATP-binding protein n=1 Tax=Planotetraspora sp. A-T 1434 TaxID=2979219 RepID=UPI0021C2250C|nr:ATP-binding protein [Planotetraspora sp. A-T 1434]MCT9935240.1 ATP-binding protein [Planotetraspora sp. A-T 1434]
MPTHRQWPITDDLAALREHIQRYAAEAGLTGTRLDDLVIAANEAAINVLEHGGGVGTLAIWRDDASVAVEVVDNAGLLSPADVPRDQPPGRGNRGYGLWLINRLCDAVSVDQSPGRSRIRLSIRLAAPARTNV